MTASRPDNEAIFHAARDVPDPDRRRAYVREACGEDEARIAHVEALLQAADAPDSLLDRPAGRDPVATIDQPTTERPGTVIGPYKLLEQIGEGGFGVVFMAEQTQPVRRKVALKVLKPGMDTRQVVARFEAERQALAIMDHPNIAKVHDGGATASGRPYFVMELVKGVPITDFCDQNHLSPRQRLELFLSVCQAVQHAHQKGIIHRDLKPSNVLVTVHDTTPVVKVIDFGVAKALGQTLTDKTLFTGFAQMIGTPLYMSPEQAGQSSLDIDTRSDIYSLGVLLYELLTGTTPFTKEKFKEATYDEIRRIIREEEPPRPSTRLSSSDTLPAIALARQTEPAKLTKLFRGELDWIVMKALDKDRTLRYETANGFGMDVQRYLAGEPVLAAPASQWYRLRKLLRRHRGRVVAAGLVLLTLVAGIAGTTWGLVQKEHQRQLAEAKKQEAVNERDAKDKALKAERQALQQAFAALRSMTEDVVERKFAQGTVLTEDDRAFLRGIIEQYDAFAAIKGNDADSRAVRAEGRMRVGYLRSTLGELKEAEEDYDEALSTYQQLVADFRDRPEFRRDLAKSHNNRGNLLRATGRPEQAEKDFDQALSLYKQLADEFPYRPEFRRELAKSYSNRGVLLRATGRPMEAEKDYDQAVSLQKQLVAEFRDRPEFRQALARSYLNRGALLYTMKRLEEAEEDYGQALRIQEQLAVQFPSQPEYRKELAGTHNNRGALLSATGRLPEAEKDFDQALSTYRQLAADFPYRPDFRQLLALSHNSRAVLLKKTGRPKEAEKDYDQALSMYKQLAADFPNQPGFQNELAYTGVNLALLHHQQGNWAAAKRLLLEGRPHHLAALKADPRNPTYCQFYRNHLNVLTGVHAALLEQQDAVRTAATRRDLAWSAPADAYDAACFLSLCIPIVANHPKLDDKQRKEATRFYGDAAMTLLRDAVSKGFKDVAQMQKDTDLDPLRQREDFQNLVSEEMVKIKPSR
jgi:serine/threonine protein kinase/Tfp pilus assembly protein PilF